MPEFLKENDKEIIRNIMDPNLFDPDSFEIINHSMEIMFIVGVLRNENEVQRSVNPGRKAIQAVKFPKPTWTIDEALEWLQENMKTFAKLEKKLFAKDGDLREIKGVEIFSAGTWNGDTYTIKDIDDIIAAFEATKDTVRPFLKLGHSEEQEILANSGLPNAGTIGRLYRVGMKLVADFQEMPRAVFDLVANKAYKKVSSEIFLNVSILDKKFKNMLGAVALLGAETPGVMNLSDIMARFGFNAQQIKTFASQKDSVTIKAYQLDNNDFKEAPMPNELKDANERIADLEKKLTDSQADVAKFTKSDDTNKKELDGFKTELAEIKKDFTKKEDAHNVTLAELQEVQIQKDADKLESDQIITPGSRKYAIALLSPEKKEYSFTSKDKEGKESTKTLTKYEVVQAFAKNLAVKADVNLEEDSEVGKETNNNFEKIDAEIKKYAAEHDVDYGDAYVAIAPKYEKDLNKVPTVNSEED